MQFIGTSWDKTYLDYAELLKGGTLSFTLGDHPSRWGTQPDARPYSFSRE